MTAFDGTYNVEKLTHGLVNYHDLTTRLDIEPADWIMCLEVRI